MIGKGDGFIPDDKYEGWDIIGPETPTQQWMVVPAGTAIIVMADTREEALAAAEQALVDDASKQPLSDGEG